MRELILQAIRNLPNKEADSGRYMPVKRQLHEIVLPHAYDWKVKHISKNYNLDTFDYAWLSDEQLLAIYTTFCRREWTQR